MMRITMMLMAVLLLSIHNDEAALACLRHRVKMEPDFYEEPSSCLFEQLRDTFERRRCTWCYDLGLKEYLEWMLERDNHDRELWSQTANSGSESPERVEMLARRAMDTDSTNLEMAMKILAGEGYPHRCEVGEFAVSGKPCRLLDASRVNEWRRDVGLLPITIE